jgi:hypothetical protein
MRKITWQGIAVGIIAGIVLAPQIRRLPLVDKLPTL